MKKRYFQQTAKHKSRIPFFIGIFSFFLCGFSAQANIYTFRNVMMGAQEVPPNGSPGTAVIAGTYDDVTNTISYSIIFSGLTTPSVAAHFHAPGPPGVIAPVIIPFVGF